MRVTFCGYDTLDNGGPTIWLRRLLPALRERGLEVDALILGFADPPEPGPLARALDERGVRCTTLPYDHFPYTEERVDWLLARLCERPPDVFVPNLMTPALYAARWTRAAGIPGIGVLHSDHAFYRAMTQTFAFGSAEWRLDGLVAVSAFLESSVSEAARDLLLRRIPCGVPLPAQCAQPPAAKLRLLYAGRLADEAKRIREVARALCRSAREIDGVEACIAGDGPQRKEVAEILRTEGAGRVRYLGPLGNQDLQREMAVAHAIVLLSEYEGLPIALLEGMACGLVPICTPLQSGIPELVEHGQNGLLVADRGDAFVAAVRRLKQEPGLWQRLSVAARERIEDGYTDESSAEAWLGFLHECAQRAGPRRPLAPPKRIVLPPRHPDAADDYRRAGLLHRGALAARRLARRRAPEALRNWLGRFASGTR